MDHLKFLSAGEEIEIPATDGSETLGGASDVFHYIEGAFNTTESNVPSKPTAPTKAQVFEMVEDGDFKTIFTIPGRTLDSLTWEQSQIKAFAKKHKKWLREDGYATFFLFKLKIGEEWKFFVAYVYVYSDGSLHVYRIPFSRDNVWRAECRRRFVIPQLPSVPLES